MSSYWARFDFRRGISRSFSQFCSATSLSGFQYLTKDDMGFPHKFFWFCVNATLISLTVFFVLTLWHGFLNNPTLTSLERSNYPVDSLPFPGVSVCSINKISKQRAKQFAEYIANKTGREWEEMYGNVILLGSLIDFNDAAIYKLLKFQSIIESIHDVVKFDTREILKNLTTPCDEMLQDCSWKGAKFNCSDSFHLRLTYEGYCCLFNYAKSTREKGSSSNASIVLQGEASMQKGLSFVVNNDVDDYIYTKFSTTGINLHIFIPTDFPDKNSGGLYESIINFGTETTLLLEPTTVYPVAEIFNYPLDKRKCYAQHERHTEFGSYSASDCLVDCQIESMKALCNCVPFMIPVAEDELVCTLADIECLNKYKGKWSSLAPPIGENTGTSLRREKQDSLICPKQCYPSCQDTVYSVVLNTVPTNTEVLGNNSIVHIFYRSRVSNVYKQDVVYYWFEILSNFGGIFGLVVGVSWMSIVEIAFYFCYRLARNALFPLLDKKIEK